MKRGFSARRPSPAMIVAIVALVSSLTGGAVAAVVTSGDIVRNAVKSKHIANGKVKNKDLKDNTIKTTKVRNGSLLAEDFLAGQLPRGEKGERGEQGEQGEQGVQGPAGVVSGVIQRSVTVAVADNASGSANAVCADGETLIGGGAALSAFVEDVNILSSRPSAGTAVPANGAGFDTWRASARNPTGGTGSINLTSFAICTPTNAG